jgi:hypothetical protein
LKAIAALRAKIMHRMTRTNLINKLFQSNCGGKITVCQPGTMEVYANTPKKKPISANGMAKMVWENFIKLRYFLTLDIAQV